jgi:hypothetical protein
VNTPFEPDYRPPAHDLARFDQAYAEAREHLDAHIGAHREHLAEGADTRELCIAGLAQWLLANSDLPSLAQILAVAVNRLAEAQPDPEEDA